MKRLVPLFFFLPVTAAAAAEMGKPEFFGPEFEQRFIASYGFLSEVEPRISEVETALLEKLAPLVKSSPDLAQTMLESMMGEGRPVSAAFNQILGNIYYTNEQWRRAEAEYLKAVSKFSDFRRAWNSLGTLRTHQEKYPEAIDALSRSIELGASDAQTFGMLGYALLQSELLVAAEIAYDMAVLRSPENVQWLEGKARLLSESGRHTEAITAIDELLANDPSNLEYWRLQANAYLALDRLPETARNLEIARMLGPLDANALYLLGNIYIKQGMPDHALEAYLAAMDRQPARTPTNLINVARSLLYDGQFELARRLLATMEPDARTWLTDNLVSYDMMQARIALHDGSNDDAVGAFERVLERDPLNAEGLYRLAQVYADDDQRDKARYYIDKISGDANYEYAAKLLLFRLLLDQGQYNESLASLRQALRLNPTSELEDLYNRVRIAIQSQRSG